MPDLWQVLKLKDRDLVHVGYVFAGPLGPALKKPGVFNWIRYKPIPNSKEKTDGSRLD